MSILFARPDFYKIGEATHDTVLDFQFQNDVQSSLTAKGVWDDFTISSSQVDLSSVNASLKDYNQVFNIKMRMFVTNDKLLGYKDRGLLGIIGISPCPPQNETSPFNQYSFYNLLGAKLGGINNVMWDINQNNKGL